MTGRSLYSLPDADLVDALGMMLARVSGDCNAISLLPTRPAEVGAFKQTKKPARAWGE